MGSDLFSGEQGKYFWDAVKRRFEDTANDDWEIFKAWGEHGQHLESENDRLSARTEHLLKWRNIWKMVAANIKYRDAPEADEISYTSRGFYFALHEHPLCWVSIRNFKKMIKHKVWGCAEVDNRTKALQTRLTEAERDAETLAGAVDVMKCCGNCCHYNHATGCNGVLGDGKKRFHMCDMNSLWEPRVTEWEHLHGKDKMESAKAASELATRLLKGKG